MVSPIYSRSYFPALRFQNSGSEHRRGKTPSHSYFKGYQKYCKLSLCGAQEVDYPQDTTGLCPSIPCNVVIHLGGGTCLGVCTVSISKCLIWKGESHPRPLLGIPVPKKVSISLIKRGSKVSDFNDPQTPWKIQLVSNATMWCKEDWQLANIVYRPNLEVSDAETEWRASWLGVIN